MLINTHLSLCGMECSCGSLLLCTEDAAGGSWSLCALDTFMAGSLFVLENVVDGSWLLCVLGSEFILIS